MPVLSGLRHSARSFARTPGLSIALILTIALGIGTNAIVYGFVRGLLVQDTPLTRVGGIVSVFARDARRAAAPLSLDDYARLRGRGDVFEWLGAARESQATVARDGHPAIMATAAVTPELARALNLRLDEGIVISDRAWRDEFGSRADVRGEQIQVDGAEGRIGGVAPESLEGLYAGREVDVWMPLADEWPERADRGSRTLWAIGRLREGLSPGAAEIVLAGETGVVRYTGMTPEMTDGLSRVGALLGFASAGVFVIAIANVVSFLLGRASARSFETSTRVALGASRAQLARELLSDSVLVSVAGAALGVLVAVWTADIIPAFFFEQDAEHLVFAPDRFGIFAASAGCAAITIVCGLVPFFEIRHDRPATVLRRESAGPSLVMIRFRSALVVLQMTCCCAFLISAGLLVQSFRAALQTTAGHRLGQPILASVEARRGSPPLEGFRYFEGIEKAAQSVIGASSATWTARPPGSRPVWASLRIEPARLPERKVTIETATFTSALLRRVVLPPIAGRMFGGGDTTHSCRVAVVTREAAELLFDTDPVGRSVEDATGQKAVIIGVIAMRKENEAARGRPTLYFYENQQGTTFEAAGPRDFHVPSGPALAAATFDTNIVSPGYFDAMGFSIAGGGVFPGDPALRACGVAVVNQEAAERYFDGDAVGAAVVDRLGRRSEIIGVVHAPQLTAFQRRAEPAIYFQMADTYLPRMTMLLGTREADDEMLTEVRRRLEGVRGGEALPVVKTLEAHLNRTSLAPLRIATVLVGAFAATALVLGVLGLYGALSDAARQRQQEIAVRIALGAPGWRLVRQVVEEGSRLAAAGAVAGMLASILVARSLARITLADALPTVWVWVAAPLVLLGGVAVASVLPAYRALQVDPLTITRREN